MGTILPISPILRISLATHGNQSIDLGQGRERLKDRLLARQ